jgi:hypothetical protein
MNTAQGGAANDRSDPRSGSGIAREGKRSLDLTTEEVDPSVRGVAFDVSMESQVERTLHLRHARMRLVRRLAAVLGIVAIVALTSFVTVLSLDESPRSVALLLSLGGATLAAAIGIWTGFSTYRREDQYLLALKADLQHRRAELDLERATRELQRLEAQLDQARHDTEVLYRRARDVMAQHRGDPAAINRDSGAVNTDGGSSDR